MKNIVLVCLSLLPANERRDLERRLRTSRDVRVREFDAFGGKYSTKVMGKKIQNSGSSSIHTLVWFDTNKKRIHLEFLFEANFMFGLT